MKPCILIFLSLMIITLSTSCQNDKPVEENPVVEEAPKFQKEGQRNRRGYPIGTIQEATQLLAGAKAKSRELNKRMTEMMKSEANGQDILEIGKPLDEIRPMIARLDSITTFAEQGKELNFLSDRDMGKIEYREQNELDALIDSLSYLNSLIDQVLTQSDLKIMKARKADSE